MDLQISSVCYSVIFVNAYSLVLSIQEPQCSKTSSNSFHCSGAANILHYTFSNRSVPFHSSLFSDLLDVYICSLLLSGENCM